MFEVKQAQREAAPVTAAFVGQSGSGKTYSALLFARGLVGPEGKIVVIDTEGKRSLIYADDEKIGGFMHIDFTPPYSSGRFQEAMKCAVDNGADAIIIDSASHEHEAEGGMLDYADKEEKRLSSQRGAARSKWIKPKLEHNRFIRYAVGCPAHVIFCIRLKAIVDTDSRPAKTILEPVCEKNLMHEMTIALQLETGSHKATFTKVPLPFQKHIRQGEIITVDHGKLLMQEAGQGEALDKDYQNALTICRDVCSLGSDAFRSHWKTVSPVMRDKLKAHMDEFKNIAEEADRQNTTEKEPEAPEFDQSFKEYQQQQTENQFD